MPAYVILANFTDPGALGLAFNATACARQPRAALRLVGTAVARVLGAIGWCRAGRTRVQSAAKQ